MSLDGVATLLVSTARVIQDKIAYDVTAACLRAAVLLRRFSSIAGHKIINSSAQAACAVLSPSACKRFLRGHVRVITNVCCLSRR
jgi:hypothetical protein